MKRSRLSIKVATFFQNAGDASSKKGSIARVAISVA
jgi:hypothetical protein